MWGRDGLGSQLCRGLSLDRSLCTRNSWVSFMTHNKAHTAIKCDSQQSSPCNERCTLGIHVGLAKIGKRNFSNDNTIFGTSRLGCWYEPELWVTFEKGQSTIEPFLKLWLVTGSAVPRPMTTRTAVENRLFSMADIAVYCCIIVILHAGCDWNTASWRQGHLIVWKLSKQSCLSKFANLHTLLSLEAILLTLVHKKSRSKLLNELTWDVFRSPAPVAGTADFKAMDTDGSGKLDSADDPYLPYYPGELHKSKYRQFMPTLPQRSAMRSHAFGCICT